MLRKRDVKVRKGILETLMRDMQGTAAQKLALFEKLKAAGGFANASGAEVAKAEKTLRAFATMEKGNVSWFRFSRWRDALLYVSGLVAASFWRKRRRPYCDAGVSVTLGGSRLRSVAVVVICSGHLTAEVASLYVG
jgi:hypothetical protein